MPLWDQSAAGANAEIGKIWDVTAAGAQSQINKAWDVTTAGAQSLIYTAEITVADIINTTNWASFTGIAGYTIKGPQEDTPRNSNVSGNCIRAIWGGAKLRATLNLPATGYYYYHFYHGSYGDEKGYSVLQLKDSNWNVIWQSDAARDQRAEPYGIWGLGAGTYYLEHWVADDGQVRCWQADIVNLNELGSSDINYMTWIGTTYCSGKNGSYIIPL